MKSLPQIIALYQEIDKFFEDERQEAIASADEPARELIERKQLLNDQAYFVLCWGQLESELDDACRAVIQRRQSDADWEMRRGFDFYDPNDKRLSGLAFVRRVALVLDSGVGRSGPYATVMSYYETRNRIAHGKLGAQRILVSKVVADFYVVQSAIKL